MTKRKTQHISESVYRMLYRIIKMRNSYLYKHSNGTALLAVRLGRCLGFSREKQQRLRRAVTIHDIGKIGLPDAVLQKPSSLNAAEWGMVKNHAQAGYDIIRPLVKDQLIRGAVLHHHENFDGSGYPRGLKGHKIPLAARLLRIVDTYDSMTTNRPYRSKMTPEQTLKDMRQYRRWFDPKLLKVFEKMIRGESKGVLKKRRKRGKI